MIGLFSTLARSSASLPHGYQSTGLYACCRRYGLCSSIRRLGLRPDVSLDPSLISISSALCWITRYQGKSRSLSYPSPGSGKIGFAHEAVWLRVCEPATQKSELGEA